MGHITKVEICNPPVQLIVKESISEIEVCVNGVTAIQKTVIDSAGVEEITYKTTNGVALPIPAVFTYGKCNSATSSLEIDNNSISWLPICVGGVQWFVGNIIQTDNTTGTYTFSQVYKLGANGNIVTVQPAGVITNGNCSDLPITLKSGAGSIANGALASTLGPDGTTWLASSIGATNLRTVTVLARRSNTASATLTGGNKVVVTTTDGAVTLLTGESITFSAEDGNIQDFVSVATIGNSAALVIYNRI